jgi:hypothetical protein
MKVAQLITTKLLAGDSDEGKLVSLGMQESTVAVQKVSMFGMIIQQKYMTDSYIALFYLSHRLQ